MEVFIYFCVFLKFIGTFLLFYKKIFFYMPGSEGWSSDQHVASGRRGSCTRVKIKAIKTCSKSLCFIVEPFGVTYVSSYMPEHITDKALYKQHGQNKNYYYNLWEYLNVPSVALQWVVQWQYLTVTTWLETGFPRGCLHPKHNSTLTHINC